MNIAMVSSEIAPFAKTGGLADVTAALSKKLVQKGHTVTAFMPRYQCVSCEKYPMETAEVLTIPIAGTQKTAVIKTYKTEEGVTFYFIENQEYYDRNELYGTKAFGDYPDNLERFTFFSKSVLETMIALNITPDIMHCNDWQSSLVIVYLKTKHQDHPLFHKTKTVYTIHNLKYQGLFGVDKWHILDLDWQYFNFRELEFHNLINLMKAGLVFADKINTVSKRYAEEIQTPKHGEGLEHAIRNRKADLCGILNGVDYDIWNPETDPHLFGLNYSKEDLANKEKIKKRLVQHCNLIYDPETPVIGLIARLENQKGLDVFAGCFHELMSMNIQLIVLGTGDKSYHKFFNKAQKDYPDKISVSLTFSETLAHQIEAGCDMFLMPSYYEPCGLNQMYSLKYGTLPIVHETGGLADTIEDGINGFSFSTYNSLVLMETLRRAIRMFTHKEQWTRMMQFGMSQSFSWEKPVMEYEALYETLLET